jgi:UDP-glucose 4-epimerase
MSISSKDIDFPYKKALVTGGAGFIGSHLIEELLSRGLEVTSIDDYVAGKKENLKDFLGNPNFREVNCDITDYNKLKQYFEGIDIVFHQAASKKTICLNDPRRDLEINAQGTFNVLELARDFGVKKVVHASTGSVYGEALYYPQDETHPLNPTSYYGVSKLAGEKYASAFDRLYGLDTTVLRYFHVYGPRQEYSDVGGVVSIFIRRAIKNQPLIIFGDGTQQRSFTYVRDVVAANILVALRKETKGECYNCASGIKVTVKELADKVLASLGKTDLKIEYADWTPGDIKVFDVDNSKLKGLGFEFKTDFDRGLSLTIDWFKDYFSGK